MNKKKIEYGLFEIRILNFYETDPNILNIDSHEIQVNVEIQTGVNFDLKNELIIFTINAEYSQKDLNNKLFGIQTLYSFKCKNFRELFPATNDNTFKVPDRFMGVLFSIAFSGTRGILFAKLNDENYKKMYLPFVNTDKILQELKITGDEQEN